MSTAMKLRPSVPSGTRSRPAGPTRRGRPKSQPSRSRRRDTEPVHVLDPQELPTHTDRLFRAAWAMCGSREEAEDLVQETFAKVLEKRRVVRGGSDLAYLMRGLHNTFISSRRAADSRPQLSSVDVELSSVAVATRAHPETAAHVHE